MKLIDVADVRPLATPDVYPDAELSVLVDDVNALLTVRVPSLTTAEPEQVAAAKAVARLWFRDSLNVGGRGVKAVSRTNGPLSERVDYTTEQSSFSIDELADRLNRMLCVGTVGTVHSVPIVVTGAFR